MYIFCKYIFPKQTDCSQCTRNYSQEEQTAIPTQICHVIFLFILLLFHFQVCILYVHNCYFVNIDFYHVYMYIS